MWEHLGKAGAVCWHLARLPSVPILVRYNQSQESLQRFLAAVDDAGSMYGLQLHWGELQQMNVSCSPCLMCPDGSAITPSTDITYLGSVVSNDGRMHKELVRRLGMAQVAQVTFRQLARLWKHSALGRRKEAASV